MIAHRSFVSFLAVVALAIAAGSYPVVAQTPRPVASPAPAASPSPTPAPEALDKAIPRLEARLKADPNDRQAQLELATDYLQAGRADLGQPLTAKLIAGGTKTAQVYFLDGSANLGLGKIKEAIASLEQASNLEPTNMSVLSTLSQAYLNDNRGEDAERVAKRALTFNKDSKEAYENYGFVLVSEKKYDEARAQFELAAKLDPKDPHPVVLEARAYQDQGAIALASQVFDRAVAIDPKNLEALLGKAQVQALAHNVKEAAATYEQLLKLQTDDNSRALVIEEIGKVYAREKMDGDADAAFRRAIDAYPSISSTHVVYGDFLLGKNDKAGAEREWKAAVGPNRDNAEAVARLGDLAMQAKDFATAVDQYKRVAELAPNDSRVHLFLAQAYMGTQNFSGAQTEYKASYQLQRTGDALVGLAAADMSTKNYAEAIEIYESLLKNAADLVKQNPGLIYNLGQAYQGANQLPKARDAYALFLTFLQANSQGATELKQLIDNLDKQIAAAKASPKPAASAAPKPASSPKPAASPKPAPR